MNVNVTRTFRGDIYAFIRDIPLFNEKISDFLILAFQTSKIHISQNPIHIIKKIQVIGTLDSIGGRAKNSQFNVTFLCLADKSKALINKFQIQVLAGFIHEPSFCLLCHWSHLSVQINPETYLVSGLMVKQVTYNDVIRPGFP